MDFMLRTLLVTAMAFALEFLGDELLHLTLLSRLAYAFQQVAVFGTVGLLLLAVIDGRLLDARVAGWYRYPAYSIWLLGTSLPVIWPPAWPIGLALFFLLLLAGGALPAKPAPFGHSLASTALEALDEVPAPVKRRQPRLLVSQVGFLRGLLTVACIWLPLIRLEEVSAHGTGAWIARMGYFLLGVACFVRVLGRLEDAGRLPRPRYGFLLIGLVLLARVLRRSGPIANPTDRYAFLFSAAASVASMLHPWLSLITGYEALALFVLIQIPLALLPSKPGLASSERPREEGSKKRAPAAKTNELALCGPLEYLRIITVIACLWVPLIYMDHAFAGSVGSWIARFGYFVLGLFWLTFANGRLDDAGWGHSWYPPQFALVVCVASLLPFAVHWINAYEVLVIFVLIQTPTVMLRSKPKPEEPLLESGEQVAQV
jgi:hypothetical protein